MLNETSTAKFQQLYKKIGQLPDVNAWNDLFRKVMKAFGDCKISDVHEKNLSPPWSVMLTPWAGESKIGSDSHKENGEEGSQNAEQERTRAYQF